MNHEQALSALRAEVAKYKGRSYKELAPLIGSAVHAEHTARSGHRYQIEINAFWDSSPNGKLRLVFAVDDGGLRAFKPLTRSTLLDPGEVFNGLVE